jgi:hypothetical protein
MTKERKSNKQPRQNPVTDKILIPTLRPDTTEIVAKKVITQMMATLTVTGSAPGSIQPSFVIPAASWIVPSPRLVHTPSQTGKEVESRIETITETKVKTFHGNLLTSNSHHNRPAIDEISNPTPAVMTEHGVKG